MGYFCRLCQRANDGRLTTREPVSTRSSGAGAGSGPKGVDGEHLRARLVEEGLRRLEFALIDFRGSPVGRQVYIQGSSLAVWEVMMIVRAYKGDAKKAAKHLE
jgi:hypothetical protein